MMDQLSHDPRRNAGIPSSPKLMGREYYEDEFNKILAEWKKFINGQGTVDESIVPSDILASWVRSRNRGLDPGVLPVHEVLTGQNLDILLSQNEDFITISRPFMKNLYRFLEGSGFLVGLFDRKGYILEIIGDHDILRLLQKSNVIAGALWDEANSGTNASGLVVILKKPVQVFGCQHYNRHYHQETASGAPIFNPQGEFIGGISLTGRYYRANPHTLGMTVAAAHAIENELRIREAFAENELAFSFQKTVIGSIPEALITIDNKGCITLLNDNARKLLYLTKDRIEGEPIQRLFGMRNRHFLDIIEQNQAATDVEVRIFSKTGSNDYALTINPIFSPKGLTIGKILIMNEINRLKTLVTKMIGAKAKFHFNDIQGQDIKFLRTVEQARMVSQSNSNVLLLGKSGTGKDIFAQAIHNGGDRRNGPYVAINCGAIPRDLILSELFGYSEGAFTGSRRGGSQGKFELADGGTIFLDEIAETPLEFQTALLRVIEERTVTRIGGTRVRPVNVRIVAATNKDLQEEVRRGNFREDLYYRLNVFAIHMVPLSERRGDISLLTEVFVKKYGNAMGKRINKIDPLVIDILMNYAWPGNVRELQNVIERMMNVVQTHELTADIIPREIIEPPAPWGSIVQMESGEETEKAMIMQMIRMKMKKNKIAEKLNISRSTLYRKLEKYQLTASF
ncbi:MAG: Acetoin dehydrogenase operon transcriptional activator AcoR [Syntrophus sp. SKADARSKE-3]|nr:Acetoin dehydrogenase operon transcriptional activator AcoR [Syntrophus sp. SKADARSKE-3]